MTDAPSLPLDALEILGACRWMKIRSHSVRAVLWTSGFGRTSDVTVRRKKAESFVGMLLRAAALVKAGHQPTRRVPVLKPTERCRCGAETRDLVWVDQLKQRACRRCALAWHTAATNNDMAPSASKEKM